MGLLVGVVVIVVVVAPPNVANFNCSITVPIVSIGIIVMTTFYVR